MTLESTVEALAPGLLRYCRARQLSWATAEDVAQDVLVVLVQRWRRYGRPDDPAAFVFSVARRRVGRALWRRRLLAPLTPLDEHAAPTPAADERLAWRDEAERVCRLLRELPAGERDALLLVAVVGLEQTTAARALGIGRSALKMRLSRARRRLRGPREVLDEPLRG